MPACANGRQAGALKGRGGCATGGALRARRRQGGSEPARPATDKSRPGAGAPTERERATVTSVQAGLPAEFKHITKRRRRN